MWSGIALIAGGLAFGVAVRIIAAHQCVQRSGASFWSAFLWEYWKVRVFGVPAFAWAAVEMLAILVGLVKLFPPSSTG